MSKIHVLTPSGDETQFDEPHLRSMWEQGLLNPDAEYWKEGMADWAPLSEYFALNPEPIEDFAQPASPKKPGALTFQKNPQTLTAFLILMLWASLAFEVLSLFGDYAQLRLISGPFTEAEAEANDNRQSLIGVGYLVVFLVTAITFLKWIYRANLNSRGFGAQNMQFSPRGAVGYYFVPFVNLVRPYQAMKEIWQISHGPSHWQANPGSALLGWWWALWLISGVVGQLSFRLSMEASTLEQFKSSTTVSIIGALIGIPLDLIALVMVKAIAHRQNQLVTPPDPEPEWA